MARLREKNAHESEKRVFCLIAEFLGFCHGLLIDSASIETRVILLSTAPQEIAGLVHYMAKVIEIRSSALTV
jgi:hypothetical protein